VRVCRLLRRQGFDATAADLSRPDPIAEESPLLAGIGSASIQGRIALGPRAGRRVWRVGKEPDAPWVLSSSPRHAHIAGFDLHANVAVPATDRARLEQLCRYLLRPPVAQDRLRRLDDDHILLTLKTPWADGTRHLLCAPMELLEKLAALTPRPRIPSPFARSSTASPSWPCHWIDRPRPHVGAADPRDAGVTDRLSPGARVAGGRASLRCR
jgi:hypothetical protein